MSSQTDAAQVLALAHVVDAYLNAQLYGEAETAHERRRLEVASAELRARAQHALDCGVQPSRRRRVDGEWHVVVHADLHCEVQPLSRAELDQLEARRQERAARATPPVVPARRPWWLPEPTPPGDRPKPARHGRTELQAPLFELLPAAAQRRPNRAPRRAGRRRSKARAQPGQPPLFGEA